MSQYEQVGNAVPVLMAKAIAVQLQSHLEAQQAEAAAEKPVKAARTKARAAQVGNEMSQSCARPVTPEEFERGYAVCDCGKFAHVFRASTLSKLPKGYNGELCKECACLMVAVEMLTPNDTGNGPRQAQLAEGPR